MEATTTKQPTCEDRVESELERTLEELRALFKLWMSDAEAYHDDLATRLDDYALSFDYVEPDTFKDQPEGYFRYQLSYGGPADEFRIYANESSGWERWSIYRIEYWFLDWFDGASIEIVLDDFDFMEELVLTYFTGEFLTYTKEQSLNA